MFSFHAEILPESLLRGIKSFNISALFLELFLEFSCFFVICGKMVATSWSLLQIWSIFLLNPRQGTEPEGGKYLNIFEMSHWSEHFKNLGGLIPCVAKLSWSTIYSSTQFLYFSGIKTYLLELKQKLELTSSWQPFRPAWLRPSALQPLRLCGYHQQIKNTHFCAFVFIFFARNWGF